MGMSNRLCLAEVQGEIQLFHIGVVGASVFCSMVIFVGVLFRRAFEGAPGLAAQYFMVTGSVMVVMGLLVSFLFAPQCPQLQCDCTADNLTGILPNHYFALTFSILGLAWCHIGNKYKRRADLLENGESQGGKDTMFDQVSTVEMA